MEHFIDGVKNYAVFSGRARRTQFWMYTLFYSIAVVVLSILDVVTGSGLLSGLFTLAMFVPTIAITVRRLHDTGRAGWWVLMGLVPLVGGIILLIFFKP